MTSIAQPSIEVLSERLLATLRYERECEAANKATSETLHAVAQERQGIRDALHDALDLDSADPLEVIARAYSEIRRLRERINDLERDRAATSAPGHIHLRSWSDQNEPR